MTTKSTILTGIRVNNDMTLGNFLGALLPMVRLANQHSKDHHINIFVPDLHTIIADIDGNLQKNILNSIKYYLAAGLEINENVHIYRQSHVPAHSELAWILDCFATMGEMNRMIQWKEKKGDNEEKATVGIFNYPVLMAADILLYDAKYVPVGEDQFQHIELTRDLAFRINHKFDQEVFIPPAKTADQTKFMNLETGLRIRDLTNPEKKMSKSTKSESSKIMMGDEPNTASKKIMSATTDSLSLIKFDFFNQPGLSNLLQIESLL
jgi:tryptophanyl-tRNA synthetase